jgi:hypothetical protein
LPFTIVDDLTAAESVLKGDSSNMQSIVNRVKIQSDDLKFTLNVDKCKEIRVQFSKVLTPCSPLIINDKEIEHVTQAKLLGVTITNDLKWNFHADSIVKKASKRMYFLRQLKRAKVPISDLVHFYCTCFRSVIEYASPVFHHALPAYLSDDLERLQKRALATILGYGVPYKEALATVAMPTLHERRSIACGKLFRTIVNDPNHKLYDLLPDFKTEVVDL